MSSSVGQSEPPPKKGCIPTYATFTVAGASGISAWLFVHPMDVLKNGIHGNVFIWSDEDGVRMQLGDGGKKPMAALKVVFQERGFPGLYAGLSAAITRQAVYTTLRLGLYDFLRDHVVGAKVKPADVNVLHRAGVGLAAGGIASFMSCPVEVCMVRMQGDARLPPAERMGYKHVGDALVRIAREEGLHNYWRGATPTVSRAMVVSMTQLGTYDQAKTMITPFLGDNTCTHLASALCAAVIYSYASLPLDTAKTVMQSQKDGSKDPRYTSMLKTIASIVKDKGFTGLWKGFTPYFARSGGHTVLMFLFKEQYTRMAKRFYGTASS